MRTLFLTLLIISLLAACAPAPATTVATESLQLPPTPTNSLIATPLLDTETPPRVVTPSPTAVRVATETLAPEQPTPDIPATIAAVVTPVVLESVPSPDGDWLAEITRYDCTLLGTDEYAFERLELVNQATGSRKEIATQLLACGGLGAGGLGSLGWSDNSRYFYYTDAREGVPDGLACYWERPMYAYYLNEEDTTSVEVDLLKDGPASPDGRLVAMEQDGVLEIWDRNEGEITTIDPVLWDWAIGPRSWSPDGKKLATLQTESECLPYGRSVLTLVDLDDLNQVTYFSDDNMDFRGVEWREPDAIVLFAEDGRAWSFNPETGELTHAEN